MSKQPKFDVDRFLTDAFTDFDGYVAFLDRYGFVEISRQGLYKHWSRKSLPPDRLAVLLGLLELDRGAPVSLAPYLK